LNSSSSVGGLSGFEVEASCEPQFSSAEKGCSLFRAMGNLTKDSSEELIQPVNMIPRFEVPFK
jgi:hypothetical protein